MILPIKDNLDWELIRQKNQTQINKDNICKNCNRVDHCYKVRDKVMITNNAVYKHKTPYNGPFVITQCWANGRVILKCGAIKIRHNISWIKTYTSDTNVEDINIEKYA